MGSDHRPVTLSMTLDMAPYQFTNLQAPNKKSAIQLTCVQFHGISLPHLQSLAKQKPSSQIILALTFADHWYDQATEITYSSPKHASSESESLSFEESELP